MTTELANLRFDAMVAAGAYARRKRLEDRVVTGPHEPSAASWAVYQRVMELVDLDDWLDDLGILSRRQQ